MAWQAALSSVADAASGSLSAIPYLVPTSQDKENEERLKILKRKAQLDALGLTAEEREGYFNALNQQANVAREALQSQQEQALMAFQTTGAGQALKIGQLAQEQGARLGSEIGQRVLQEDIIRREQERQELEDRIAYQAMREQQKAQAVASILMPILASAPEAIAQQSTFAEPKKEPMKDVGGEELDEETQSWLDSLGDF